MYRKFSYDECIDFIAKHTNVRLFEFQKEMLKSFCEGREVRSSRCAGRSLVAEVFGKYVAHVYDRNNYEVEPELVISWEEVMEVGLISEDCISNIRRHIGEEQFKLEYCEQKIDAVDPLFLLKHDE